MTKRYRAEMKCSFGCISIIWNMFSTN